MTKLSTPDLCDQYADKVKVLEAIFNNYGAQPNFSGQVVTIKCFEDNSVLKTLVEESGLGRVIVMDGGGSLRRAILGDQLAEKAASNGWSGLIINGCIRDCDEIAQISLGVKAINTHPVKTQKRGIGDLNVDVSFAGQTISPGDWVYADNNGVVVSSEALV